MGLRSLSLRDFAIVDALELELADGFTALTGETGAGKSILVDAIQLVLGARADALSVREGAARCDIAARFDATPAAHAWLDEAGFTLDDGVLLRRVVDAGGKSRAWINGSAATATQLRELGEHLLDIHGQHAWQSLTRPAAVRDLLDGYAGLDRAPLLAQFQHWRAARQALQQARDEQHRLTETRERLAWQIGELNQLAPGADEWPELNRRHQRQANAQAIVEASQLAAAALETDDDGAVPRLARARAVLLAQRDVEPAFAPLIETIDSCLIQAQDVAHSLGAYRHGVESDPQELAALDARMAAWISLARRFRQPPENLAALLAHWQQELARVDAASDLTALEVAAQHARTQYMQQAQRATVLRAEAAPRLAAQVTAAMQELGMQGGRLEVQLNALDEPGPAGLEAVQLRVAAHAGSSPRPIERVASGGELSRLALALAVTTSQLGTTPTLVFDEIDSGVGGAVAVTVGQLLRRLGLDRQVLCVTHLAQVAASANHHLLVSKSLRPDGRVASSVQPLDEPARVAEVARMLAGDAASERSLAHAREMLASPQPESPPRTGRRKTRS